MSAIRLARGFTGRSAIVKFEGCYHGHADCTAGEGGLWRPHIRQPSSAGVPTGSRGAHHGPRLQRCRRGERRVRAARRRDRCRDRGTGGGQYELACRRVPGSSTALREHCTRHGAAADLRRGHDRLPRRAAAARRRCSASARTSRRSARSSAAACRSARSAVGATSWSASRRSGPSTRPGRSRAIRSLTAAGLATLGLVQRQVCTRHWTRSTRRLIDGLRAAAAERRCAVFSAKSVGGMFGLYFTARTRCKTSRRSWPATRRASAVSSTACSRRHLSRALAVRGRLRLGRARRRQDRRDDRVAAHPPARRRAASVDAVRD